MYRLSCVCMLSFLLSLSLTECGVSFVYSQKGADEVAISNVDQLMDVGIQEGREYIVKAIVDLQGEDVNIPAGVTISFVEGGAIVNGTLIGNDTKINSKIDGVLGVRLKGTWNMEKVTDLLFSRDHLSDAEIISNLNMLQSDVVQNEIVITRDYMVTINRSRGVGLDLKSNTTLILDATLTLTPNDYKSYNIVNVKGKENVFIKGGKIVGDVGHHIYYEECSSEWGMGININESSNITIENMTITLCTGDGIYISGGGEPSVGIYDHASHNIVIRNVICDANRRQGLSVIHVDGLSVHDCSFINTGQFEFTGPGSGIDIEPNVKNGYNMSVRNVVVDNCIITNNKGAAVSTSVTYEVDGKYNFENLLFTNCETDGRLKAQSTDLTIRNCSFSEVRCSGVYAPTHITLEDCSISGGYGMVLYAPSGHATCYKDCLLAVDVKRCTLTLSEENTGTESLISCYKGYVPNLKYVNIENSRLVIPSTQSEQMKIVNTNFMGKLKISHSILEFKNNDADVSGIVLVNNRIYCNHIVGLDANMNNVVVNK